MWDFFAQIGKLFEAAAEDIARRAQEAAEIAIKLSTVAAAKALELGTDAAQAAADAAAEVAKAALETAMAVAGGAAAAGANIAKLAAEAAGAIAKITEEMLEAGWDTISELGEELAEAVFAAVGWPTGDIEIIGVRVNPVGPDWQQEYILLRSRIDTPIDMAGWTLRDIAGHIYKFEDFTLAPGATIRVWTGPGTDGGGHLYWGRRQAVWNNLEGDIAVLADAEGNVSHRRLVIAIIEGLLDKTFTFGIEMLPVILGSTTGRNVSSSPRLAAQATSIAEATSAENHDDSGVRYEFDIREGVVRARRFFVHPDGTTTSGPNDTTRPAPTPAAVVPRGSSRPMAISHDNLRRGEKFPAPVFDMVAAAGSRVFAKERGKDNFYFTSMEETFTGRLGAQPPPSNYFKLDPEMGRFGAQIDDLLQPLSGSFNDHPATWRYPLYRALFSVGVGLLGQAVAVEPRVWHRLDARPGPGSGETPKDLQRYPHVTYGSSLIRSESLVKHSIDFEHVLDIGAGHAHWYSSGSTIYGGEMQPLRESSPVPVPWKWEIAIEWAYRIFNGPVSDGDGFIDGTCNFYALVRLRNHASKGLQKYALLWLDEQSSFTHRWREVHPGDYDGLMLALVKAIEYDPKRYRFDRTAYWCPFKSGHITEWTRLASAATALAVNGTDPESGTEHIYSINFSYATMDRSWRWRSLPEQAAVLRLDGTSGDGSPSVAPTAIHPESLVLRDDMTLHIKGRRDGVPGRWFQTYLPADGRPVPQAITGKGGRPATGDNREWKFVSEESFSKLDRFSHFGVLSRVDSRSRYYKASLSPKDQGVARRSGEGAVWVDQNDAIYINKALPNLSKIAEGVENLGSDFAKLFDAGKDGTSPSPNSVFGSVNVHCPPTLFNEHTQLTLLSRGSLGWIAVHADKRDDDLIAFSNPADQQIELTSVRITIKAALGSYREVSTPPVVQEALLSLSPGGGGKGTRVALSLRQLLPANWNSGYAKGDIRRFVENVWQVHVAALDRDGRVVTLLKVGTDGTFTKDPSRPGWYSASWAPSPEELSSLHEYLGQPSNAGSTVCLWCEDVVGQVAVPEKIRVTGFGQQ